MGESSLEAEAEVKEESSWRSSSTKVLIGRNPDDNEGGGALLHVPARETTAPVEGPSEERSIFPDGVDEDIVGKNGLELQIALDSLALGNLEPLKRHLARIEGLDPEFCSIRSQPYDIEKDRMPGSQFGRLDQIGEPQSGLPESRPRPPVVRLHITDHLYQYQPLQTDRRQVRLLRLGPKDEEGAVNTLELQVFDLDEAPRFYALAIQQTFSKFPDIWLWADGICIHQEDVIERGHQVSMMGEIYGRATLVIAHTGHHSYEKVTLGSEATSASALDALQTEETNMVGSVVQANDHTMEIENSHLSDAVSSDKHDVESPIVNFGAQGLEKNNDLPLTAQPAISLMNYLTRIWGDDADYTLIEDEAWQQQKIPDLEGENILIWAKLFQFWNEDWFYRSWILQEAVLGKKVILLVNDAACSLDFIMEFWDLAKRRDTPEFLKRGPLADEYARVLHLNPITAMKALRAFKHREDSHESAQLDPESDLLSLLSLSRQNLASDPIIPDYFEANTAGKLYQTITATHVKAGLGPKLLQYAGIDHKIDGTPSWVPDWSYQSRSKIQAHLYNCSGPSVSSLSISEAEPDKLRVRGAIIDRINANGMAWRYYSTDREQEKFARFKEAPDVAFPPFTDEDSRCAIRVMAQRFAAEKCPNFDSPEAREIAVARTLVMDCTWRGERTDSDPSFIDSWNTFERLYGKGIEEDTPPNAKIHKSGVFDWVWDFDAEEESTLRRKSWPFEVAMQEAHKGRRFCITKDGYLCTTPYDAERGDHVVILEGFRTPFVLRRDGEEWNLVGDCYVHGIMDGELVFPLRNCEVRRNEIAVNSKGEPYALQLSSGFAKFQDFIIV